MGPWYKRVTALVESARTCQTREEVISILGDPDRIERASDLDTPSRQLAELGATLHFGDEQSEEIFTYVDPYRPRHRYKFGFKGSRLNSAWRETVQAARQDHV